ncbi:DUF6538 domain-containing protein [Ralstonia pseudosolanacearum]
MPTNYLIKRGGRYSLRRKIPQDLRKHYGRVEIVRALGTSDPDEAKRRVREKAVQMDREFDAIRARLNPPAPVLRTFRVPVKVHDPEAGEDIWSGKTVPVALNIAGGQTRAQPREELEAEEEFNGYASEDMSDPDEEPEPPSPAQVPRRQGSTAVQCVLARPEGHGSRAAHLADQNPDASRRKVSGFQPRGGATTGGQATQHPSRTYRR